MGGTYFAQPKLSTNYTVNEGLPTNEIYHVIQDDEGYIWLATDEGVCRFNGRRFEVFTTKDGLESNIVFQLYKDKAGRIWMASVTGRLCYYYQGVLYPYKYNTQLEEIPGSKQVICLQVDDKQNVTLGYAGGGMYQVSSQGEVIRLDPTHAESVLFLNNQGGELLISGQIRYSNRAVKIVYAVNEEMFEYDWKNQGISNLSCSRIGDQIYVANGKNLIHFNSQLELVNQRVYEQTILRLNDYQNHLEVCLYQGGILTLSDDLQPILKKGTLSNLSPLKPFLDDDEGRWYPTLFSGLWYNKAASINYHAKLDNYTGHPSNFIADANGRIIYHVNAGNTFNIMRMNSKNGNSTEHLANVNSARGLYLIHHPVDSSIYILSSTQIYRLDPITKKTTLVSERGIGPIRDAVWHNNQLIIAAGSSVYQWSEDMDFPEYLFPESGTIWANCLEATHDGLIVGSSTGLYKYKNNQLKVIELPSFRGGSIIDLLALPKGEVLVATEGDGLLIVRENKTQSLISGSWFNSQGINRLYQEKGVVYASTNNGIIQIENIINSSSPPVFSVLDQAGNLPGGKLNHILKADSIIYVNFNNQLISFNQSLFNNMPHNPKLHMEAIVINDSSHAPTTNFVLEHYQNYITFEYGGISFKLGQALQYDYRLLGLTDLWTTTSDNSVSFPKLLPGEYTFQIKCSGSMQIVAPVKEYSFTIHQPFWNTWAFRLVLMVLVAGLITFFWLLRVNAIRAQNEKANKILDLQQQALHAQMDPHFVYNSLGSIQAFIITGEKDKSIKYISQFSRLMRKLFNTTQLRFVPLVEDLEMLTTYIELEILRSTFVVEYTLNVDEAIDIDKMRIPPMLMQPVVENVFKHAFTGKNKKSRVEVSLTKQTGYLICTITDNGKGYEPDNEKRTTSGSNITQQRLELLCENLEVPYTYDITANTAEASGTSVNFHIPLKKDTIDESRNS